MRPACTFLVPGDWESRTGGYLYDRQIVDQLRTAGREVAVVSPGDGFPWPDAAARRHAQQVVEALPDGALVVADGLGFGVLPELVAMHAARLRWVALVHHPLALESGLSEPQKAQLFDSERRALASARQVIVTSASTARALAPYGVAPARIDVVEPGTDPASSAPGGGAGPEALSLLCVATVTPRKGHVLLLEALAGLRDRRWHLHCAGSQTRDADEGRRAVAAADRLGLAERVTWHGEVDAGPLAALYAQADLFVLPSWHEGYGMALAEALARGLPVVSTAAGAIVDTVPADAGILVPPGDVEALREALRRVMDAPSARRALAAGARAAAIRLPRWADAGQRFAAALQAIGPMRP
ncbi:glycosyltransferase family 4 protein [Variovorax sp. LT1R16]|uniref:glycosyltransferase family 4 protein n=1 Tax=Variovorax sp. LT1R16 TaxID=3443728 RepID=UPI003F4545F5